MSARTRSSAAARAGPRSPPPRDRPARARSRLRAPRPPAPARSPRGRAKQGRCKTNRLTVAGPTVCTSRAAAAEGTTPAASRALSSSRKNSGFPPVAAWHERQNSSVCLRPQTLPRQRRRRKLAQRSGHIPTAAVATAAAPRVAPRPRPASQADVPPEAASPGSPSIALCQIGSESQRIQIHPLAIIDREQAGALSARFTTSQYRLCNASKPASTPPECPSSGSTNAPRD